MKNIISITAATGILFLANSAFACTSDTPNEWECLIEDTANLATAINLINQGKQGPYTFSGTTKLKAGLLRDRKSTRLNSSHVAISYAVFCLKKKKKKNKM